jgi:DNA-binding MurR/RpiR family transcriptional regulator
MKALMVHPKNRLSEKISRSTDRFTPSDYRIADYLLRTYPAGLLQNASEIATKLNINVSTVTRFFPKIGYRNIKAATADFRGDIQFLAKSPMDRFRNADRKSPPREDAFDRAMELDWSNIQQTFSTIDEGTVSAFMNLIGDKSRAIFVLGTRKEFSLAYYFYYQVASFRDNACLLNPTNLVDQLSRLRPDDLLVVFDFRRYSRLHAKASQYSKDVGGQMVVFADSPITPAAERADCLFLVTTAGLSAFDSYTAALTLINALITLMIEKYGHHLEAKYERLEELFKRFKVFNFQKDFSLSDNQAKGELSDGE